MSETKAKYVPQTLAERVCRTLEGLYLMEYQDREPQKFADMVYCFCHLVPGTCIPHEDWMQKFLETEQWVNNAMMSPAEKEAKHANAGTQERQADSMESSSSNPGGHSSSSETR